MTTDEDEFPGATSELHVYQLVPVELVPDRDPEPGLPLEPAPFRRVLHG